MSCEGGDASSSKERLGLWSGSGSCFVSTPGQAPRNHGAQRAYLERRGGAALPTAIGAGAHGDVVHTEEVECRARQLCSYLGGLQHRHHAHALDERAGGQRLRGTQARDGRPATHGLVGGRGWPKLGTAWKQPLESQPPESQLAESGPPCVPHRPVRRAG